MNHIRANTNSNISFSGGSPPSDSDFPTAPSSTRNSQAQAQKTVKQGFWSKRGGTVVAIVAVLGFATMFGFGLHGMISGVFAHAALSEGTAALTAVGFSGLSIMGVAYMFGKKEKSDEKE